MCSSTRQGKIPVSLSYKVPSTLQIAVLQATRPSAKVGVVDCDLWIAIAIADCSLSRFKFKFKLKLMV